MTSSSAVSMLRKRKVAGAPVAHRQAMEAAGEHVHLARQIDLHDALLRGVQNLVEILAARPVIRR